ncbi:YceI family protein [Paenibacillus tarimensis]
MKKKSKLLIAAGILIAGAVGGYTAYGKFVGNNVEIESVIPAQGQVDGSSNGGASESLATAVSSSELNGSWAIADASKIYWSVTTSKETVNFVNDSVQGSWNVNVDDISAMSGEGTVDMTALDSGNGMRDGHVKDERFLAVDTYPEATFKAESFSGLPAEWEEGVAVPVEMTGTLTVRGVEKEVTFASEAMYSGGQLVLSGTTTVLFSDFGMENPHTVVLETENELEVRLELVLDKA